MFPPRPSGPSTGWHPLRIGWEALYSPFPWEGLTLVSHFPPCLVSEAGEALGFQKIGSTQRQKASFVRREGSREAQGSQRCFINLESEWSAGPQFWQEQNLQNGKHQNSKKLSRCRALSGKRAGPQTLCCCRSGGGKEQNQQGNLHRGCTEETLSGPQTTFARWRIKLSTAFKVVCVCVGTETHYFTLFCLLLCWPVSNSNIHSRLKTRCKVLSG